MTKHMYPEAGKLIDIGWERGTQSFYPTVYDKRLAEGSQIVYDSDYDLSEGMLDLPHLEVVLARFGLGLRADVRAALLRDQAVNAAPYIKHHDSPAAWTN